MLVAQARGQGKGTHVHVCGSVWGGRRCITTLSLTGLHLQLRPCPALPPPPRPPNARSQIGFLPHAAHLRPLLEEHNDSGGVRVHVRVRSDPDGVARGQDRGGGKRSTKNGQIPVAVTVQATPSFIHLVHACLEAADLAPLPGTGLCAPPRMPPWCVALKPRTPLGALLRTYCSCRRGEGPIHTNMPRC